MRNGFLVVVDLGLILPVVILLCFSLITLSSINSDLFRNQLFYIVISFFVFIFFSRINLRTLLSYSVHIYIASLVVLLIVLILGVESRGAVRWIDIFGIRIQFSEIFKPILAVSVCSFIATRENKYLKTFLSILLLAMPVGILIFLQPDLGNAIIYGLVLFATLFTAGFPIIWFLLTLVFIAVASPVLWLFLRDYQKERLFTFINPQNDPLGSSYNVIQSIIAVGSGMLIGKGYGQGTQSLLQFLPERHTDFVFATLSEEFGFIGSLIVILSFSFFLYRIYILIIQTEDRSYKLFCIVSFYLFLIQFFTNIGMNLGILPIVGVTLPFMSYGGSSLVSSAIFLGLLSTISTEYKLMSVLEIK